MMTVRPLVPAPRSGSRWPWLTSAAEMAAVTCRSLAPAPHGPPRHCCFPRVATRTPAHDLSSVAAARGFARLTLQRWGIASRSDDITLVISELLANALRHSLPRPGGWPVRFGLLQSWPGSALLCAVADPGSALPAPAPSGPLAECGRGLHVVEELSDRWGCTTPSDRGKVVWATFDVADVLN
jgi:anti-sigma regulatory factor (Ser/Thr protein kinase)